MSTTDCAAEDDLQFPAFLTRNDTLAAPEARQPCNGIELRAEAYYWGAAARLLRFLAWPFTQIFRSRELSFVENDMSRNGAGITHQTPLKPVLDDAIANPLVAAIAAFRAVEGEKTLNQLLHTMLLESNDKLQRYGVQTAFRETAELESLRAQLKRQQEANQRGSAEHKALQHAANEALQALAIIADAPHEHDTREDARAAIKAWEVATNSVHPSSLGLAS